MKNCVINIHFRYPSGYKVSTMVPLGEEIFKFPYDVYGMKLGKNDLLLFAGGFLLSDAMTRRFNCQIYRDGLSTAEQHLQPGFVQQAQRAVASGKCEHGQELHRLPCGQLAAFHRERL